MDQRTLIRHLKTHLGNVVPGGDGKLKVKYPLEWNCDDYFQRIDVMTKKSALKSLVNDIFY